MRDKDKPSSSPCQGDNFASKVDVITEVKDRLSLLSLCDAAGIELTNCGKYHIGKFPFHKEEKGKSFVVNEETEKWFCNGVCNLRRGEDVISLYAYFKQGHTRRPPREGAMFEAAGELYTWIEGGEAPQFDSFSFQALQLEQPEGKTEADSKHEALIRQAKRQQWEEDLLPYHGSDLIQDLAHSRQVSLEAVQTVSRRGLLFFRPYDHQRITLHDKGLSKCKPTTIHMPLWAWVVTDKSRHQAVWRRLDGQLWASGNKAHNLPGCSGTTPIGVREAARFPIVAIVEGGPDLLAAFEAAIREGILDQVGVVMMSNGGSRFTDQNLVRLRGKRFRIFGHNDSAGQKSAREWLEQLKNVGSADADIFQFPKGIKDLNEAINSVKCRKTKFLSFPAQPKPPGKKKNLYKL